MASHVWNRQTISEKFLRGWLEAYNTALPDVYAAKQDAKVALCFASYHVENRAQKGYVNVAEFWARLRGGEHLFCTSKNSPHYYALGIRCLKLARQKGLV
jgi:hypothetical protein